MILKPPAGRFCYVFHSKANFAFVKSAENETKESESTLLSRFRPDKLQKRLQIDTAMKMTGSQTKVRRKEDCLAAALKNARFHRCQIWSGLCFAVRYHHSEVRSLRHEAASETSSAVNRHAVGGSGAAP